MFPKIKSVKALENFKLEIIFDDNKHVLYDVEEDINSIDNFKDLKNIYGLWKHVQLDESRTVVYWNDQIDLPSDTLYEYGVPVI